MIRKHQLLSTISCAVFAAWAFTPSLAVAAVNEIVVTSQKRAQNLQKVPISVSAFDSDMLDKNMVISLEDIKNLVPNLYLENALAATTTPKIFMRGVGVDNQVFSFDTPIGFYVDGVYFARVTGALVDLFDIERVEVLRGPQSVLFGRNNTAGSVRMITKDASLDEIEFVADVSYGRKDQRNARVMFSAPIVKGKLGVRLSGSTRNNDGFMKDISTGKRFLQDEVNAFRGSILLKPNENWKVTLRGDVMVDGSEPNQASNFLINPDNNIFTFESSPGARFINEVTTDGFSLTVNGGIGNIDVTSISAYRGLKYRNANDVDGRADVRSFEVDRQDLDESQVTQEIFLTGKTLGSMDFDWVAGLFYFHEQNNFAWALRIFAPPTTQFFDQETNSASGYAQGTYPVTDRLRVTAGGRYTFERKVLDATQNLADGTPNVGFNFKDRQTVYRWTWNTSVDYDVTEDVLAYFKAGTGFRSGGFNGSARDVPSILSGSFGPEKAFSVEGGVKSDWFDNRLRFNADYFYVEYSDLQLAITLSDGTISTTNVDANVHGLEVEATAEPIEGLTFNLTIGTMFDHIKNSTKELKNTPTFNGRLGVIYAHPVSGIGGIVRVGADVSYQTDSFNDTNNAPLTNTGDFETVNANITYETEDGRWSASVAGFNITDELHSLHTFNIAGGFISSTQFPNKPARWLATIRYRL